MHLAHYRTAINGAGEPGQYPLSTESLDFIQHQILLLQQLTSVVDGVGSTRPVLLKSPTKIEEGILIYRGELLEVAPLTIDVKPFEVYAVTIQEVKSSIKIQGDVYRDARTQRTAHVVPLGTAGAIGKVQSREQGILYTPGVTSLQELSRKAATLLISTSSPAPLTGDSIIAWGKMIILEEQLQGLSADQLPMSKAQLIGAILMSSQLTDTSGNELGFFQELETRDGLHLKRIVARSNAGISSQDWLCSPNQLLGAISLTSRLKPSEAVKSNAFNRSGIFSEAVIHSSYEGISFALSHKFARGVIYQCATTDVSHYGNNIAVYFTPEVKQGSSSITLMMSGSEGSGMSPFTITAYSA